MPAHMTVSPASTCFSAAMTEHIMIHKNAAHTAASTDSVPMPEYLTAKGANAAIAIRGIYAYLALTLTHFANSYIAAAASTAASNGNANVSAKQSTGTNTAVITAPVMILVFKVKALSIFRICEFGSRNRQKPL